MNHVLTDQPLDHPRTCTAHAEAPIIQNVHGDLKMSHVNATSCHHSVINVQ